MEKWRKYYLETKEKNVNLEHVKKLKDVNSKLVYDYINRCLQILEEKQVSSKIYYYVSETLKYSDVSKVGDTQVRHIWKKNNFDLFRHNIGSAQIYVYDNKNYDEIVRVLIKTHGLIGQYIRGEVALEANRELYELINRNLIDKDTLKEVLKILNEAVIKGVSVELYQKIETEVNDTIDLIINGEFNEESVSERMHRLNHNITKEEEKYFLDTKIIDSLTHFFKNIDLWYYEVSLGSFTLLEQIKILLIINNYLDDNINSITFEPIMRKFYIDYNDTKVVNLYKKRIIEACLRELEIEDLIAGNIKENPHFKLKITKNKDVLVIDFTFSKVATKLVEFCKEAYTSNTLYNKAVYLLYDLLGFRKDQYDRFYNEIDYLTRMNGSMDSKKVLLNYIVGDKVLDVGPGGGGLMDLIEASNDKYKVYGIDISSNVIEELNRKKLKEKHNWNLVKGDALKLENYFSSESLDTIIYSSIIHELFSYIEYKGKKFNLETVIVALQSAWKTLKKGGRIIIRDGIKTEPVNMYRIIEFKNVQDMQILDNYCHDFQGRKVGYEKLANNKVKMLVNDAMEFLYTYTWGENSYALEVKEQFGYLTPSEYVELIEKNLDKAKIILCNAFLQNGYELNLLNKITIYDENGVVCKLPNSTCIIVIEKEK